MPRGAYAIAYRQPQAALGLSMPAGKKIAKAAKASWAGAFLVLAAVCASAYVFQMNRAASKGYALRDLDNQVQSLSDQVTVLEDQAAKKQSLHTIEEEVKGLGYVAVDQMEFIDVGHNAYAVAK